jgi:acyl dehydratase
MLASLGGAALDSLRGRFRPSNAPPALPGPELSVVVPAPSDALVEDFLSHIGADASAYAERLPAQLFPQWGLPVALRALRGSGLPITRMLNGGCRLEQRAPLLRRRELLVRARLSSISSDERRSVICQRIVTEQAGAPEALIAEVYGIIRNARSGGAPKQREPIPTYAFKLDEWRLESDAGLHFALLTGDINPLHWLGPYARALGFGGKLLHGFAVMARAQTALERALAPRRLRVLDVRFVRPLTLPAQVSLYLADQSLFVGAAGEPPYLTGTVVCD